MICYVIERNKIGASALALFYAMLEGISGETLKKSTTEELKSLCEDVRGVILHTVSQCGGHLSSNLGAVEITVALHKVFDFPRDKLIFDVGHQCYAHKLLSGRAEKFSTLRKKGGISGFPKRAESEYDCYDTGHAGTALSAALGIAKARDIQGEDYAVIALIGDGSFNNGLIYEALNSLNILKTPVLIILNDNGMSISPTVGGTHAILEKLQGKEKKQSDIALFERYGLQYSGVVDGNDVEEMVSALENARRMLKNGSVLLHVHTKKGRGYSFSENAPDLTHGVAPDNSAKKCEYSTALGEELLALAENNGKIVAVTAAMTDALGLREFYEKYPERAFDVGICEEHASVLCAAMASQGLKPYYAIYSTFLQRAFDEIIHDICGQDLPVTFCIDRAGISGADGETHQGVFDLSYLSLIPNLAIASPKNIAEFRALVKASERYQHPLAIRYPRCGEEGEVQKTPIEMGTFEILHNSMSDIVVLAVGERCIALAEQCRGELFEQNVDFTLVNARFCKPLDEKMLANLPHKYVFTLEDNVLAGGFGDAVARFYANSDKILYRFGYSDAFIPHGSVRELAKEHGLDVERIKSRLKEAYESR